jgi:hypothetical protein
MLGGGVLIGLALVVWVTQRGRALAVASRQAAPSAH